MAGQLKEKDGFGQDIATLYNKNPFFSNTELVYTVLLNRIVDCRIEPGYKLNQEQLAIDMGVSRTPVRDALSRLEHEGYIVKGGQSYTVYEVTANDYAMLLDVRAALEVLAAKLSCSRMLISERKKIEVNLDRTDRILSETVGKVWSEDFTVIDKKEFNRLITELARLDQDFHLSILNASHNPYLKETYFHIKPRIHFFRNSALTAGSFLTMAEWHRKIYNAILDRNEQLAQKQMERHLELTLSAALRYGKLMR